jgi:hypothetical protein
MVSPFVRYGFYEFALNARCCFMPAPRQNGYEKSTPKDALNNIICGERLLPGEELSALAD